MAVRGGVGNEAFFRRDKVNQGEGCLVPWILAVYFFSTKSFMAPVSSCKMAIICVREGGLGVMAFVACTTP